MAIEMRSKLRAPVNKLSNNILGTRNFRILEDCYKIGILEF